MLRSLRRRWWLIAIIAVVVIASVVGVTVYRRTSAGATRREAELPSKVEAPPDLEKLRDVFGAGMQALQRNDGAEAVRQFESFTFGPRAVEEYRLYYLAHAYELTGNSAAARVTLAKLWRRSPKLIHAKDVAFNLANLYDAAGDWHRAEAVYAALARRPDAGPVAPTARLAAAQTRLNAGDVAGALFMARSIVIHNPRAKEAPDAVAIVRALTGTDSTQVLPLTASERIERAVALTASSDPQTALDELTILEPVVPPNLASSFRLQKGLALHALRRYEDSNKVLEPLTSGEFKYAIPALRYAAKNYAVVAAAINPTINKVLKEKKKVGTVKVRVGKGKKRRTVTKPKFAIVSRTVKLVDLAKKNKKDEYERLASERLKDLLSLKLDNDLRYDVLNALGERAMTRNQDAYVQELVREIIKIDRDADPALQHFWDKAWAAYARGDLATAKPLFRFIADTYSRASVRRQSEYWYARSIERQGAKAEARQIYQKLAAAPYADLYALHAVARGATRQKNSENPLKKRGPDWAEVADKSMPEELELAYELTALSAMREAYLEIRRNTRRANMRFAEALMADIYNADGNSVLLLRSLQRAWPQLGTVEQDSMPVYFLRMAYPDHYDDEIEAGAKKQNLDANLVRALILQESYYNPKAKSSVGATGLMQLMPATANDHAKRLGIVFATSRLENPSVNIKLGTFHLRMLVNMFKGNEYLAIASYNAGQGNVLKWRRGAPGRPMDEFIESIPFPETRSYVKRITFGRSVYERINS